MINRRKLLLTGAIGAPFVLCPRRLQASTISIINGLTTPQPNTFPTPATLNVPAMAATYGFNTTVFYDNFSSLSTIDMTNSLSPGFNWYLGGTWPNGAVGPYRTQASADPTGITLNGNGNGINMIKPGHWGLATAAAVPTAGYVGKVFSGGGYFECTMNYNPTQANTSLNPWPQFWSHEIEDLTNTSSVNFLNSELDFYEAYPQNNGAISTLTGAHEQTYNTSGAVSVDNQSANFGNVTLPGSPVLTNFHRYGCLWVPMARNGGTGLIKRFFDGIELTGGQGEFSYSATTGTSPPFSPTNAVGTFSQIDNRHMFVIIASGQGSGWPANFNQVFVVQ